MMNQEFKTTAPYQKAGTDVTMFPLDEQAVFLFPIIDFHTREKIIQAIHEHIAYHNQLDSSSNSKEVH